MTAHCDEMRLSLGSYVLGALDAEETEQVRRHLASCAVCRTEYEELAGLPGMLARLSEAEFAAQPSPVVPSSGLLDRVLRQAAAERNREAAVAVAPRGARTGQDEPTAARRSPAAQRTVSRHPSWGLRLVAAAGGLTLVFAAGGVGWWTGLQQGRSGGVQAVAASRAFAASDPATGVSARVTATPTTWGNSIQVRFTGVPKGTWCHLVAVGKQGRQEIASSWRAEYGERPEGRGEAVVPGAVGMSLDQIARFDIVTAAGRPLLSIPV